MEMSQVTTTNVATTETAPTYQESQKTNEVTLSHPVRRKPRRLRRLQAKQARLRDDGDFPPGEDVEQQDRELSDEERIFLKEFPFLKEKLEEDITKCRACADDIEKTRERLTKTSVVTNAMAVTSGAMSILGLALAPVTAGGSLVLSAAGQGLGTVAGAASIATSFWERYHKRKVLKEVSNKLPTRDQKVEEAVNLVRAGMTVRDCGHTINDIKKHMQAFQVARAHPRLAKAAKRLVATGQASARRSQQVQKAFGGTTLAMARKTRFLGSVMTGLSLGMDLNSFLKDWKQLKEGTSDELAETLRAKAMELERKLTELTQHYERLKQREENLRTLREMS